MKYILNSAVIPVGGDGNYNYVTIGRDDVIEWLRLYESEFISRLDYEVMARYLESLAPGVRVPVSRDATTLHTGDEALVVRLKYRMRNPGEKIDLTPAEEDYDFGLLLKFVAEFE